MNNNHIIRRGSTYISGTSKKFVTPVLIIPGTGFESWDNAQKSLFITTLKPFFETYVYDRDGEVTDVIAFRQIEYLDRLRRDYYPWYNNYTASAEGETLARVWNNVDTEYHYYNTCYCRSNIGTRSITIPYGAYWHYDGDNPSNSAYLPESKIIHTLDDDMMFLLWTGNGWREVENFPLPCYKSTLNYNVFDGSYRKFTSARYVEEEGLYYEGFWKNNLSSTAGIKNGDLYFIDGNGYYVGILDYLGSLGYQLARKNEAAGVKKGRINGIFVSYTE